MNVARLGSFLCGACLAFLLSTDAKATVTTYSSDSAFDAATTGLMFYAIPQPAGGTFQSVSPSIAIGPITFTSPGVDPEGLFLVNDGSYGAGQTYLDNDLAAETLTGAPR